MSKIRICDICGKKISFSFNNYYPQQHFCHYFYKLKEISSSGRIFKYEICYSCMMEFKDFVNSKEENKVIR